MCQPHQQIIAALPWEAQKYNFSTIFNSNCVQETRWKGSGARVTGKGISKYKIWWQSCKDGNTGSGYSF